MARYPLADAADAELAGRAAGGDNSAFEELYRRHADAAWRVAMAVTNHKDDAADAVSDAFTRVLAALPAGRLEDAGSFRAYLLTTTRRAGIDHLRRRGRQQPGDVASLIERPGAAGTVATPNDKVVEAADAALVASAFRGLPERWRSVLWLTEVEGVPAKEAAPMLGMSPNGVAQLAVRARAGLRERYLQAHVGSATVAEPCRFTVERLGAYVAGALSPRDLAKVDQHLAGCGECRDRQAELEDVGGRLRRAVVPLPLGLGALALKKWRFAGGHSAVGRLAEVGGRMASVGSRLERPLAVASAALFAAGLASVGVVGGSGPASAGPGEQAVGTGLRGQDWTGQTGADASSSQGAASTAASFGLFGGGRVAGGSRAGQVAEDLSSERLRPRPSEPSQADHSQLIDDGAVLIDTPTDNDATPPPPPPPPAAPTPLAQFQAAVSAGPVVAAVAAGQGDGACTGGYLTTFETGCTPPESASLLTVSSGGSAVPAQEVRLP